GYSVGEQNPVSVSHLQFADDTLLLGVKSWANGLISLIPGYTRLRLLCCKVGKVAFLYLGLPIGGDLRRLGFWEPVLAHLKKIIWVEESLSFFWYHIFLTSPPVYAFSFFKAPSGGAFGFECWQPVMG
ncbi:cysteine-rich receptor-like protein kinase, partial [Trifolium medium]|nr:cysteine-rich receptor-like protein kinase [Trifolium medium]